MEIPEMSMISDFEAGVKCLQNPSMVSRLFTLSRINLWKWAAVLIVLLATFGSIIKRLKLFLVRFRTVKASAEPLLQFFSDDFDFGDVDDDDDDECSSVSSLDDDEDALPTTPFQEDQDFRVKDGGFYVRERSPNGNLRHRRQTGCQRFSWSQYSTGKNVVKLWDSLILNFDYEDSCKNVVSMWDFKENQKINEFFGGCSESAAMSCLMTPSQVVLSAEVKGGTNGIVLRAYDERMRDQKPALYAKWDPPTVSSKLVGINSDGVEKVYVRDEVSGVLVVGDLREFQAPIQTVTESSDGDTWWDADAVIVDDDKYDGER